LRGLIVLFCYPRYTVFTVFLPPGEKSSMFVRAKPDSYTYNKNVTYFECSTRYGRQKNKKLVDMWFGTPHDDINI
jgi:hypothetical protein